MKPHHLVASLLLPLAALALAGGAGAAASAGACAQHTAAYFYTNDSQDLARQLALAGDACADYSISIAPFTAPGPTFGLPKGDPALAVVHAQGANFHALAEVRMKNWCTYAAANGWLATGRLLHQAMLSAGYVPGRDTWAVNEVGWPSDAACQTDIFDGAPGARQGFQDFVRGLHDGADGQTPMTGVVFAQSPIQMTPDLGSYEQGLARWYSDTVFWEDMDRYVAVWAQETYADARAWGVPESTLADRAAALNAYFLHGSKLALNGGDATAAVRRFFVHAYTPLANASYKYLAPAPPGPAYGSTDIGVPSMWNFVSTQVYALRSSMGDRFGFAVTPLNTGGAAIRTGIEGHLGAAIRDSETDALGACTALAESCDGVVEGSWFPATWPAFATPPAITPHVEGTIGSNGWYTGDVTVSWDVVDEQTPDSIVSSGCGQRTIDVDTVGTVITCTAASSGGWAERSVTVARDATPPTITCVPTPATLWPPNGKLVAVDVDVSVADLTSGPAGFVLTEAPAVDAADFVVGTADVAGSLRAKRAGDGGDRVYLLTYAASDLAGNTSTCDAAVTVPHDEGG